jgi:hypothetical protein
MSVSRYWAFISYSQRDVKWAQWLHKELETYRIPRMWIGRHIGNLTIPRRLVPIFRDREELPSAGDLGSKIREALAASHSLIVICSPYAAASPWVNEEVRTFKSLGRSDHIFPLIVDGEPYASDHPECGLPECFPAALRFAVDADGGVSDRRAEPLAADAREGKDGRSDARLKLIAGILGIGFDALRRREQTRQRRRRLKLAAASAATALAVVGGYLSLADADIAVYGGTEIRSQIDRYGWSVFRRVASRQEMLKKTEDVRAKIRGLITETVENVQLRPGVSEPGIYAPLVWDVSQAVAAIYRDPKSAKSERDRLLPVMEQVFQNELLVVVDGRYVGWRDSYTLARAETAIWTVMALTQVIARTPDDSKAKAKLFQDLGVAQEIADQYYSLRDGGWNTVKEDKPSDHYNYTTALALHALLELRSRDLCWRTDCARLDEMIRASVAWLINAFVDDRVGSGWRKTLNDDKPPDPDLSIFVYGALGRASIELGIPLPATLERAAFQRLIALKDRSYFPSQQDIEHWVYFTDETGKPRAVNLPTRVFWYPWTIEALVHWLRYADHKQVQAEVTTALNRSLGHVLGSVSDDMLADMSHSLLFVRAETLYGIDGFQ